jgi:hypothetical protein
MKFVFFFQFNFLHQMLIHIQLTKQLVTTTQVQKYHWDGDDHGLKVITMRSQFTRFYWSQGVH